MPRLDRVVISGFTIHPASCEVEASVTEKELVELCAAQLGNDERKELLEPFPVSRERRAAGN